MSCADDLAVRPRLGRHDGVGPLMLIVRIGDDVWVDLGDGDLFLIGDE